MKNDDYVVIQGWMINELGLRGAELLCYATIFAFSKAEGHTFHGSRQYIADWCGVSRRTANEVVNSLIDKRLIERFTEVKNGETIYHYVTKNVGEKFLLTPCEETSHNNNICNNIEENKKDKSFLSKKGFDFLAALLSIGIEEQIAKDWMKIRTSKKASDSETAFKQLHTALETIKNTHRISFNEAISICVTNGWYGCKPSYFENILLQDYGIQVGHTDLPFDDNNKWE